MALLKIWFSLAVYAAGPLQFTTKKINVQNLSIKVAVADTVEKRRQGLMFVGNWDAYQGMVFIFSSSRTRTFWMKNTLLPLSLGFYDKNKKLFEIKKLSPAKSLAQKTVERVQSSKPARYVLEVPQRWFEKNKVQIGSSLEGI